LISRLAGPNEAECKYASATLATMGNNLDDFTIKRIVTVMREDKHEWSRFLWRESHCSWFEYTRTKYYAAEVLNKAKSAALASSTSFEEVQRSRNSGVTTRRVMDPRWI